MYSLKRAGVTDELFDVGDQVKIAGQVSTRRDRIFLGNNMLLSSGQEIILNGGAAPYFKDDGVGGLAAWTLDEDDIVDAAATIDD